MLLPVKSVAANQSDPVNIVCQLFDSGKSLAKFLQTSSVSYIVQCVGPWTLDRWIEVTCANAKNGIRSPATTVAVNRIFISFIFRAIHRPDSYVSYKFEICFVAYVERLI